MKIVFYILLYLFLRQLEAYRQEFARVIYHNPKYVVNPKAITSRISRKESYRTNLTVTILHPWGNNVTVQIIYNIAGKGTDFKFSSKVCNFMKIKWVVHFMKSCSVNITCPMPAGPYNFYNFEFPPKNFPLPLPKGDTEVIMGYYITDTMEPIANVSINIKI